MPDIALALDRYFGITEKGSTLRTELKGGVIVFLAMLYILVSNPAILNPSGTLNENALFTATALSAVLACIVTGFLARFPVAMAPGMGINAFVSYTVMGAMGFTYSQALMAVFISGLLFFIVSITGLRTRMLESIPASFRFSITAGIGLFIATVGLLDAEIIVLGASPSFGNLGEPAVALGLFSIVITFILYFRKWWGAVIGGILITALLGIVLGAIELPTGITSTPDLSYVGAVFTEFQMFDSALIPSFLIAVFALFMVDMFDSAGTLLGIGERAGMIKEEGTFTKDAGRALLVDSGGTMAGAVLGTSTVTSFIESQAGIEAGARTGLMPVVVGLLFLVALFFYPIFSVVTFSCIVGALVFVGVCMISSVKDIDWTDPVLATSSFLVISIMTLSYSISNGIGFGAIAYVIGMLVTGRRAELNKGMIVIAGIFLLYFIAYYVVIPAL